MDYDRFINAVGRRAGLAEADALIATRATLETIAERIGPDEARHLASQLPREIGQFLTAGGPRAERFSLEAFGARVAARAQTDVGNALRCAGCVMETLEEAVSNGELSDLIAVLPNDLVGLLDGERAERVPR